MFLVTILLCLALFLGSFLVGYLPFFIKIDTKNINIVSAGILVGTGLGVILPESLEKMENKHYIGMLLLTGFIVMMAVDVLMYKEQGYEVVDITLHDHNDHHSNGITLGLIIHSMADGMALGSACASDEISLEISIFIALFLHKGPMAFALTSLLQKQGIPKIKVRNHLLIFSLTSPIATFITYLLLSLIKVQAQWISNILIFSAGTFIYVATLHVIPEVLPENRHVDRNTFIFLLIGILIPLVMEMAHGH